MTPILRSFTSFLPMISSRVNTAIRHSSSGSELNQLIALVKAQNSKIDTLHSRVQCLEAQLKNKVSKDIDFATGSVTAYVPAYIKICDKAYEAGKIAEVNYRRSLFWIEYPYVVEMKYLECRITAMVGGNNYMVPLSSEFEYVTLKCKSESEARNLVEDIMKQCPHLQNKK